jgi:TonB family protein
MRALVRTCSLLLGVAILASTSLAHAQDPTGASPSAPDGAAITPPRPNSTVQPEYPPDALRDRVEGTVGLELTIDDTGAVVAARVTQPAGHGFDEAALAAARAWTFEPARRGALAIRSSVELAIPFQLPAPPVPVSTAAVTPPQAPGPILLQPPSPATPPPAPAVPLQEGADQSTLVVARRPEQPPAAASVSRTSQEELSLLPRFKVENILEAVPGLFAVQHSGGGKADQYFLRGFDADHGTDIAFSIDGTPINMVSHGHGQGFSDIHFLIPETVASIDATKGPYSARAGDFATAGSVDFRMADHIAESYAKVEVGPYSHTRLVALESPDLGPDWRMLAAAEVYRDDGPFIHPDDFQRFNGYLKITHDLDDRSSLSAMLTAYGGSWNASGVLPARDVCGEGDGTPVPAAYAGSRCLSRWDSLDPSQGGDTQRTEETLSYRRRFEGNTDLDVTAYAVEYAFQLFPNDGIASPFQPDGIQYGSEIEQDDSRTVLGTDVRVTSRTTLAGMDVRSAFGLQVREDAIHSELHRDEDRKRLDGIDASIPGPITDSNINELGIGLYGEEDFRPARWLRFVVGARGDRIDVAVNNQSQTAVDQVSGVRGQAQFSPKATMVVSPWDGQDLFVNYGRGFHSNDARTIIEGSATTILSAATGYEVGTVIRPVKGLSVGAVGFLLDLQSELTIDGDTATTEPSGPTRRYGGEFTGRYNMGDTVFADAAFTVTHARYTDAADIAAGQAFVPLAPVRTFSAGIGARRTFGSFTVLGSLHVRSMSDRYATQDGTLTATGFTLVDAEAGVRWKHVELGANLLNIGDVAWREGQFAVQSRAPGEGFNPPVGISFTPGIPRTLLGSASVYW